ncbi:cell wall integrity and stress response component 2-like isoform X1 [Cottoperca gobio]|uniref:Cell wall integrity and stress response component 2-like isoform X1 n=1 Tax=Cottoperca gobio TaxID=56716 RepID=A0A6J2Q314_COTGO|nr:cell wall integrity and stress response component 2-like isoform X1 [Cottoperca gobio]
MNLHHSLICFSFLALWDGDTGLINAQNPVRTGTEGGNITVSCSFSLPGLRKRFCKGNCEEGNILVETTDDTAQRGRYSLVYEGGNIFSNHIMYVSITKLTTSDAGRYGCGLVRILSSSYQGFEIRVDAVTSAKPTPAPSASTLTTTQSLSSTSSSASTLTTTQSLSSTSSSSSTLTTTQSLSSTSSSSSSGASKQTQQQQTTSAGPGVVLYVNLTRVVMFIVLSVALLIFCWKRASKPEEPPEETEHVVFAEANQVYEEMRSIEMSTVTLTSNTSNQMESRPQTSTV